MKRNAQGAIPGAVMEVYDIHPETNKIIHFEHASRHELPESGVHFGFADDGGFSVGNFLPWGNDWLLNVYGEFSISFGIGW